MSTEKIEVKILTMDPKRRREFFIKVCKKVWDYHLPLSYIEDAYNLSFYDEPVKMDMYEICSLAPVGKEDGVIKAEERSS